MRRFSCNYNVLALVLVRQVSINSCTHISYCCFVLYSRIERVLVVSSFSPTITVYGIFCNSALRIFLLNESSLVSTCTLNHCFCISFAIPCAYSVNFSATGTIWIWTGANHNGNAPAKCSIITPINLSSDHEIALWMTTGLSFSHFSLMKLKSNLSGRLKSHWIVDNCRSLHTQSLNIKSNFGP